MGLSLLPTQNIMCAKLLVAIVAAVLATRPCCAAAAGQMVTTGPASPPDERQHEQALGLELERQLEETAVVPTPSVSGNAT